MSKSYGNGVAMREDPASVTKKLRRMPTDPARVRCTDPGNPDNCPVWQLHQVYSNAEVKAWARQGCTRAGIGCLRAGHGALRLTRSGRSTCTRSPGS